MRFGGEATSVLWGDTASLSPPLDSSRPSSKFAASELQTAAMNCLEGLPPANHHHHSIHHAHHQHVIHLLPHSAPATPPTTPNNNLASSPPPEDGEFARKEEAPTSSSEPEMTTPKDTKEVVESSEAASPLSTEGQVAQVQVKEEVDDGNIQDDSGISPGSRGSGSSTERVRDAECGHSSGREEEEESASPSHQSEEQECPSPGSSERGPSGEGRGDDGARCASSPFSEECYSGGEDSDALRRLQFSVDRGATFGSEDAGSQGGDTYDGSGPRPDGMGSDEDDGSDINMTKPRITSQGKFKTFRCKQCDFVALTKLEFWEHSKMHIRAERLLTCPRCPFVTEYKHHLEYHLRNHFGSKPFKCPHCPYTCVNKSMLNSHLKSHSSVYQYRCADCGYATKYCHSLKLHLRKYSHQPAMVLHPDGSPNPLPVIDVYGTRRGPKTGSKKCAQQSVGMDACATTVHSSNTSTTSPTLVTSAPVSVATPAAVPVVPVTTAGHQYPAMLVYSSPPSPSQQTPKTAATSTYILPNGGAYFSTPMQATSSNISYSTFSTPQTSRPILPRVLHPTRETEVAGGSDASQMQWPREDAEQANGRKILSVPNANNRPVKCTLCEFASTSREAFAEHMMMHAANGDVGNKDTGVSQSEGKVSHQIHQQHPVLMTNGNGFASNNEAGLKEYLARMLTAVVPQMGAYRGPVPPQLQAQWHVHVQQQMQQQQRMQHMQNQPQTNGMVLPLATPSSPQQVQRPWLSKDVVVTSSLEKPTESAREDEVEATEAKSSERPVGGVPLDLTKESVPRIDSEKHIEERKGMGGSSRRKGRAFKLERISQRLQGEEEGKSSEEEDDRHSQHSEEEVSESVKRRKFSEDQKVKVDRNKDNKEDYHCPYCDIAFRDVVLYTMHMGYHGYQDPFKCNMCGQETNDKVSFFLHIARSSHS